MAVELNVCIQGDCRAVMRDLIAAGTRVQCVVTSPPYWGLRDYGVAGQLGQERQLDCLGWATGRPCGDCFICRMVEVFTLVRELLADDGVCWVNMGDSYAQAGGKGEQGATSQRKGRANVKAQEKPTSTRPPAGLKPKDLCMQPARLALALQASGWYLRQDVIWHKPNPMPESVRDRCTKAHEYLFLLTKRERYYWDVEAMHEPCGDNTHPRRAGNGYKTPDGWDTRRGQGGHGAFHREGREKGRVGPKEGHPGNDSACGDGKSSRMGRGAGWRESVTEADLYRNRRSVWSVPSAPFKEAHFATFPPALIEPCILAGSRPGDIVFDPFMGSGTVGQVAQHLGRRWLGAELNTDYINMQRSRTAQSGLLLEQTSAAMGACGEYGEGDFE